MGPRTPSYIILLQAALLSHVVSLCPTITVHQPTEPILFQLGDTVRITCSHSCTSEIDITLYNPTITMQTPDKYFSVHITNSHIRGDYEERYNIADILVSKDGHCHNNTKTFWLDFVEINTTRLNNSAIQCGVHTDSCNYLGHGIIYLQMPPLPSPVCDPPRPTQSQESPEISVSFTSAMITPALSTQGGSSGGSTPSTLVDDTHIVSSSPIPPTTPPPPPIVASPAPVKMLTGVSLGGVLLGALLGTLVTSLGCHVWNNVRGKTSGEKMVEREGSRERSQEESQERQENCEGSQERQENCEGSEKRRGNREGSQERRGNCEGSQERQENCEGSQQGRIQEGSQEGDLRETQEQAHEGEGQTSQTAVTLRNPVCTASSLPQTPPTTPSPSEGF